MHMTKLPTAYIGQKAAVHACMHASTAICMYYIIMFSFKVFLSIHLDSCHPGDQC